MVLALLERQPLSGYDIIKILSEKLNMGIGVGKVYPLLYSLRDRGIIELEKKRKDVKLKYAITRAKLYSVTEQGTKLMKKRADELAQIKKYLGLMSSKI